MDLQETIKALSGLSAKRIADGIQREQQELALIQAKIDSARNVVLMSEATYAENIKAIDDSMERIAAEAEAKLNRLEAERKHLTLGRALGKAGVLNLRKEAIEAKKRIEGFTGILSAFRMSEELKPFLHLLSSSTPATEATNNDNGTRDISEATQSENDNANSAGA